MRGRAFRRASREKRKKKAFLVLMGQERAAAAMNLNGCTVVKLTTPLRVGRMATTPHPCSCAGCGNPRKHFKELSIQERRNPL